MPSVFDTQRSSKRSASAFDLPQAKGKSSVFDLGDGAPAAISDAPGSRIWETAKGAGRTVIDLLSRPSYAAAGAAEELFTDRGGGVGAAFKRAGRELGSGIGDIKGDKEGFAQVMEQSGVGELGKLSDVLPFLYNDTGEGAAFQRGGWADPTGRGTVGLGLDIALDPTTYLTAGGRVASRFATAKGTIYLSAKGREVAQDILKGFRPDLKVANGVADDVGRVALTSKIDDVYREKVLAAVEADKTLLDPTGIKWFGQEVVSSESLKGLSDTAKKVVLSVPGGAWAARQTERLGSGIAKTFDAYADARGLPEGEKEAFKAMMRRNRSAAAMHKTNLQSRWADLEVDYAKAARAYGKGDAGKQALGKRLADWRQQTADVTLTATEAELFPKLVKVYDDMEEILVREGAIDPEQAAKFMKDGKRTYLHQSWQNADEALVETAKKAGRPIERAITTESMQRARVFDTIADGVRVSREMNVETLRNRAAGGSGKVYGELVPEYDAMKNLSDYIQQSTDAIWNKRMHAEAVEKFGHVLPPGGYDPGLVYDLNRVRQVRPDARAAIDAAATSVEAGGFRDFNTVKSVLPKLSNKEQNELAREVLSRAKSESQVVNLRHELGDNLMPDIRFTKAGDVDPYYTRWGQDGELVPVQGGLWGDKELQLPKQIVKMVEDAPRDFLMDAAKKRGLQGFLKSWDWYNNAFKAITYPFYPSGAARDTYNNVMQAFLGIGVGGFARPFQAGRVLRGNADDVLKLGAVDYTAKELNTMARDLGVIDPSGAAYVQFTGEQGAKRASLLSKARAKRGQVDNLTRTQLFINNIAAGMAPQDAAQVVKEFLFDYSELSAFDRDVMRRAMPFYVFPRKAIESYGKAIVKTPGRVANMAKPFRGREDENNSLSQWEGEGFKLRLDRDGKNLTMLNGVDLPVRTMDMLWAGSPTKTMNRWLSMASPSIKVPYEFLSGQDPFRGKPLGREQSYALGPLLEDLPKPLQVWAGYKKEFDKAGRPKYTIRQDRVQVLAEAALISRIVTTSERQMRESVRTPGKARMLLDLFTGLRFDVRNLDEEAAKKAAANLKVIQEEAVKQGELEKFEKIYKRKPK